MSGIWQKPTLPLDLGIQRPAAFSPCPWSILWETWALSPKPCESDCPETTMLQRPCLRASHSGGSQRILPSSHPFQEARQADESFQSSPPQAKHHQVTLVDTHDGILSPNSACLDSGPEKP